MSSFQLNMSALTLGARKRIARLDAAGGAVRALLSPAPSSAAASGAAALTSSPSVASGTPRMSVELLLASGSGRTGESDVVLPGGSTGGLSVFVLLPDQADKMCLGAVAGGIKFCTLDAGMCSFSTNSKKVEVTPRAIYISTGRQSAISHHFAPVDLLTQDQIDRLLEERHSKEEWIRLLLGLTKDASSPGTLKAGTVMGTMSVLDAVTPGRKRKVRYEDEADLGGTQTPARAKAGLSLRIHLTVRLSWLSSRLMNPLTLKWMTRWQQCGRSGYRWCQPSSDWGVIYAS